MSSSSSRERTGRRQRRRRQMARLRRGFWRWRVRRGSFFGVVVWKGRGPSDRSGSFLPSFLPLPTCARIHTHMHDRADAAPHHARAGVGTRPFGLCRDGRRRLSYLLQRPVSRVVPRIYLWHAYLMCVHVLAAAENANPPIHPTITKPTPHPPKKTHTATTKTPPPTPPKTHAHTPQQLHHCLPSGGPRRAGRGQPPGAPPPLPLGTVRVWHVSVCILFMLRVVRVYPMHPRTISTLCI